MAKSKNQSKKGNVLMHIGGVGPALQARVTTLQKKSVGKVWARESKRRIVRVTPVMAAHILEGNDMNRAVRQDLVDRLARDMKNGRWVLNGETVKFTKHKKLIDGQHRLYAVLLANVDVEMEFAEGLDESVMPTIDTGRSRQMQDVLAIQGYEYSAVLAPTLRWWYNYRRKGISFYKSVSHGELGLLLEEMAELKVLVPEACSYTKAKSLLTPGLWCFIYSAAVGIDADSAKRFAEGLDSGIGLTVGSPVLTLRERLMAHRASKMQVNRVMVAAFAIKAWNAFYQGRQLKILKWTDGEPFPEFVQAKR